MKFSVAICTWNRAELLDRTLSSLSLLRKPNDCEWEAIVIENNCTDNTVDVCRRWSKKIRLQIYREEQQGHSYARNRAVKNCHGDVIVWTDDDVEVSRDWLEAYHLAIVADPGSSFWGGPIRPKFEGGVPSWIQENWEALQGCFASRDLGRQPIEFNESRLPYGANFAIRTDVQRQFPFDVKLGCHGNEVTGDDEIEMLRQAIRAGYQGSWVPGAVVEHRIPQNRATLSYVYRYFVGQGKRIWRTDDEHAGQNPKLRLESMKHKLLFGLKYPLTASPNWMSHWIRAALARGKYEAHRETLA